MQNSGIRAQRALVAIMLLLSGPMVFSVSAAVAIQDAPREPSRKHHGSIAGKVIDESGKPVAKAKVELTDSVTQEVSSYESGKNGQYKIINLGPGVYTLKAEADGRQSDLTQVKVSSDGVTRQNLKVNPKK